LTPKDTTTRSRKPVCNLKRCYQWHNFTNQNDDIDIIAENIPKYLPLIFNTQKGRYKQERPNTFFVVIIVTITTSPTITLKIADAWAAYLAPIADLSPIKLPTRALAATPAYTDQN
jgi:hypothetical protein